MKNYLLIFVLVTYPILHFAQGVAINNTGAMPVPGAMLDVSSTSSGMLLPRMTHAQRNAIASPSTSLLIYQTNQDSGFYYYDEPTSTWYPFLNGGTGANSGWRTTGNTGTTVGNHFIGTIDSVDLAVYTDNLERIRVTSNGNVGIGIINPDARLHLSNRGGLHIEGGSFINSKLKFSNKANSNTETWNLGVRTLANPDNYFSIENSIDGAVFTIRNGNIGIGTTSPLTKLDIIGAGNNGAALFLQEGAQIGIGGEGIVEGTPTGYYKTSGNFGIQVNSPAGIADPTNYQLFIQRASGNVGIGTTVPTYKLHVEGGSIRVASNMPTISFYKTNGALDSKHWTMRVSAEDTLLLQAHADAGGGGGNTFQFVRSGTQVNEFLGSNSGNKWFTINNLDQRVGIGTTSPDTKLEIFRNGSAKPTYDGQTVASLVSTGSTGSSTYFSLIGGSTGSTGQSGVFFGDADDQDIGKIIYHHTSDEMSIWTNTAERMRINAVGNVGIGTATPAQKLDVYGNIAVSGVTVHTSDKRFKKNISPINDALEKVMALEGVSYHFKQEQFSDKGFDSQLQFGLIAQELEEIFPHLVYTQKDGYKGVNYTGLTPVIIEAIKKQNEIIRSQEEIINQLINNNITLRSEMDNIKAYLEIGTKK